MRTEPLMSFTYTEGPDGTMYPNIRLSEAEIGKFGQAWKTFMQSSHPERLSELNMLGSLHATMAAVDEEAEHYRESLIRSLMQSKPLPQTEDTLERAAHMEMLTRTAEELTLNEIVFQTR